MISLGREQLQWRKEVRLMKYEKPEITLLAGAADAIQSVKPGEVIDSIDQDLDRSAGAGYEADE